MNKVKAKRSISKMLMFAMAIMAVTILEICVSITLLLITIL